MKRIVVVTLALAVTAATAGAADGGGGGLSLAPAVLEREAQPGPLGAVRVANDSSRTVAITVRARPWVQARGGAVRPAAGRRLGAVALSATRFTLAPGQSRAIDATLRARPGGGSLYGVLEVVGTPQGPVPAGGIRARYRLLGALRLNPPAAERRLGVRVGAARRTSAGVVVAVRNSGNTVEPLRGSTRITGATGTVRGTIAAVRILPGATVDVPLTRERLPPGRYTATVTLQQGGRRVAAVTRAFRVR